MFKVCLFSGSNSQYADVTISEGLSELYRIQYPSDIQPVLRRPDMRSYDLTVLKFDFDDVFQDPESVPSQILLYYRTRERVYRMIWKALDQEPPKRSSDVIAEFPNLLERHATLETVSFSNCHLKLLHTEFLTRFKAARKIVLQNCSLNDSHLQIESYFPHLEELDISHNQDVRILPYHPHVKTIRAAQTGIGISVAHWARQKAFKLQELDIRHTPLGDGIQKGLILDEAAEEETLYSIWLDQLRENNVKLTLR